MIAALYECVHFCCGSCPPLSASYFIWPNRSTEYRTRYYMLTYHLTIYVNVNVSIIILWVHLNIGKKIILPIKCGLNLMVVVGFLYSIWLSAYFRWTKYYLPPPTRLLVHISLMHYISAYCFFSILLILFIRSLFIY